MKPLPTETSRWRRTLEEERAKLMNAPLSLVFTLLIQQSIARGVATSRLDDPRFKHQRKVTMVQYIQCRKRQEQILEVLHERLGTDTSNILRRVHWQRKVSKERYKKCCDKCGNKGGLHHQYLDWYSPLGVRLKFTILQMDELPSEETLQEALTTWSVYCRICAKEMGLIEVPDDRSIPGRGVGVSRGEVDAPALPSKGDDVDWTGGNPSVEEGETEW